MFPDLLRCLFRNTFGLNVGQQHFYRKFCLQTKISVSEDVLVASFIKVRKTCECDVSHF